MDAIECFILESRLTVHVVQFIRLSPSELDCRLTDQHQPNILFVETWMSHSDKLLDPVATRFKGSKNDAAGDMAIQYFEGSNF